ncbi:DUF2865 domain-containing protein [Roseibium sp. MMSF_3544]|uniref:DUF2865 domain-containing protein n=1 Tax=unclassified Roseibium TaxID=2629323 RepID=UPI00273F8F20|nr:DUF2865 domain-containing protein [Roseibium sp. MMSF_3544]
MRLHKRAKPLGIAKLVGLLTAFMLPLGSAEAASCSALKSELRQLQSGSSAQSPAAKKWTAQKRKQEKAISAASRDARHFGCSSASSSKCQQLNNKIKRMKANLSAIERQLAKSGGASSKNTKRLRQVRAAIERQNCNAPVKTRQANSTKAKDTEKPKSLLSRLFNQNERVQRTAVTPGDQEIATVRSRRKSATSRPRLPAGGAFRTLCVRTCDGYFFPVSFSTGKSQFVNDEARCSEICPAAPTELYVYRNPGGDQSQMTSLAGTPYADQPFAFRYKTEFVEGCSCRDTKQSQRPSAWSEVSASSNSKVMFADISAGLPRRSLQPSRGGTFEDERSTPSPLSRLALNKAQLPLYEDPGTLFNLEKGFDVTTVLAVAASRDEDATRQVAANETMVDGLPLLSIRSDEQDGAIEEGPGSPVFKTEDAGFRPAPERSSPVRVVGPEYFVAQ